MKKILKQFSILLLSIVLILPLLLFVGCNRKPLALDDSMTNANITSQYGFVNKIGNYIYFINGAEDYKANNKYGQVTKGALMRLHVNNLDGKGQAEMVIPELIVSSDYKSGIVIYNGNVYYASPNTTRNLKGEIESDYLNFKSAKLDGTGVRTLARTKGNNTQYRYVVLNDKVYLTYLNDTDKEIHSVDVASGADTTLVKDYVSAILPEDENVNASFVYYTMQVVDPTQSGSQATYKRGSKDYKSPSKLNYHQLFRVEISGNGVNSAKDITTEMLREDGYVAQDGSVLEYWNQGQLIYDGVSTNQPIRTSLNATQNKNEGNTNDIKFDFVRYMSKQNYGTKQNDGSNALGTVFLKMYSASDSNNGYICAFNENKFSTTGHDYFPGSIMTTMQTNFDTTLTPVFFQNGTGSSVLDGAILLVNGENKQGFTYIRKNSNSSAIERIEVENGTTISQNTGKAQTVENQNVTSDTELLYVNEQYLYFNQGSNNKKLFRVIYQNGTQNQMQTTEQILEIEYKKDWYKPEILKIDNKEYIFFADASTYGEDYVNVLNTENLQTKNNNWKAIQTGFKTIEESTHIQGFSPYRTTTLNLAKFYFYTDLQISADNHTKFANRALSEYYAKLVENETEESVYWANLFIKGGHQGQLNFTTLPKKDANNQNSLVMTESDFYTMIGERADGGKSRQSSIATALLPTLPSTEWTWQWWALFVPIGVAVAAGATVTTLILIKQQKKKKNSETNA